MRYEVAEKGKGAVLWRRLVSAALAEEDASLQCNACPVMYSACCERASIERAVMRVRSAWYCPPVVGRWQSRPNLRKVNRVGIPVRGPGGIPPGR